MSAHDQVIPVRAGEELDVKGLTAYLQGRLPERMDVTLHVEQFASGHSNLTYLLRTGNQEYVLRRPPLGPVAPKAHDMAREFQVLSAVHDVFPLAPKPLLYCFDPSVIGVPFQVMERRQGIVIDGSWPTAYEPSRKNAQSVSLAVVNTLAALHLIDYKETEFARFVHPDGYLERQVSGWLGRYDRAKTDDIDAAGELARRLTKSIPHSPYPSIIHNDLKLNNMLLSPTQPGQATAVVDWELATVGDPLTDLATTLSYWSQADDPPALRNWLGSLCDVDGMMTRAELAEAYAQRTGIDISGLDYYVQFAYFKVAVICQQIFYRWKLGQTTDERFEGLGEVARNLMEHAVTIGSK